MNYHTSGNKLVTIYDRSKSSRLVDCLVDRPNRSTTIENTVVEVSCSIFWCAKNLSTSRLFSYLAEFTRMSEIFGGPEATHKLYASRRGGGGAAEIVTQF